MRDRPRIRDRPQPSRCASVLSGSSSPASVRPARKSTSSTSSPATAVARLVASPIEPVPFRTFTKTAPKMAWVRAPVQQSGGGPRSGESSQRQLVKRVFSIFLISSLMVTSLRSSAPRHRREPAPNRMPRMPRMRGPVGQGPARFVATPAARSISSIALAYPVDPSVRSRPGRHMGATPPGFACSPMGD
jgi:hypothetical protein